MRKIVSFVVALVIFVMLALGAYVSSADAAEHSCTVTALGDSNNLSVTCVTSDGTSVPPSQIDVEKIVGDTVTVVIPEVREVVRTVVKRIPQPRETRTVTRTVRPAPRVITKTVRVAVPGPTRTVAVPGPTVFRTAQVAVPGPTETITETVRPSPRQDATKRATMDADRGFYSPDVDLGDDEVTAAEAGIGLLTLLALVGLILIAMYAGYTLGYKESEREDTHFMRALRDTMVTRGKHS